MKVITSNGLQKFEVTFAAGASVDTELPAAAALADNTANPTAPAVGAFLMAWDGANWDRVPGTSANGLTVTLSGASVVDTELPAAAALADNTANPTVPAVGAFLMLWDGANWDRAPGTTADGISAKITNTVTVDTELPAAAALADNTANPTVPGVGAFLMLWDGANWDRAPGNTANGLQVQIMSSVNLTVDTELPAAAALADNTATPTAPAVGAFLMAYDGAQWDMVRGDATNGLKTQGSGSAFTGSDNATGANTAFGATGDLGASVKGATIGISQSGAGVDAKTITIEACYDEAGTNWYKTAQVVFAAAADSASVQVYAARRYRFKSSTALGGTNVVAFDGLAQL